MLRTTIRRATPLFSTSKAIGLQARYYHPYNKALMTSPLLPSYPVSELKIVGGGIVGAMEAYFAWLE